MYTDTNYKTKKALKEAVADPEVTVTAYQPGGLFESKKDGIAVIEGPQFPAPHRWYARVELRDGVVVKVIS